MNDQTNQPREERPIRPLALLGLAIAIIIAAWLAVQLVQLIPNAFISLANLAERVHNPTPDIALEASQSESTVNSRMAVEITWTDVKRAGTYAFEYDCAPGVSLELELADGTIVPLACEREYEFADGTFSTTAIFTSERERYTDVAYYITFIPEDENADTLDTEKTLTIVNASIPVAGAEDDGDDVAVNDDIDDEPTDTTPPAPPVRYRTVQKVTYSVPVSDPHGYTDLAVTFDTIGTIDGSTLVSRSTLEEGEDGAFRFEVKNIGTKTSTDWKFNAVLPSGQRYTSAVQEPLKPQERALITVAFDSAGSEGKNRFEVTVNGGSDTSTANNEFSRKVTVTD